MSKVKNEKSDVKIDDNGKSFVKNSSRFHPAEEDLDEKASLKKYSDKKNKGEEKGAKHP